MVCELRRNYHYSDDVAEFATSLLGSAVPSVLASLVMASIVMTGRLCCLRWATGEDCVRPWCGPLAAGVDEPEKKPRLAPAENGDGRPTVCERPCVKLRGGGTKCCAPSEGPVSTSLDLGASALVDALEPFVLVSTAGSVPRASGEGEGADACASRWGAWIESAKLRPDWVGGVTGKGGAGSSGVGTVMSGGVSLEVFEFKTGAGACSGGCEGSRGFEFVGGEAAPDRDDGSGNFGERSPSLSTPTDNGASATPAPSASSDPFTRRTGTPFVILGDSEPEPTEGEGLVLSKLWGSCFSESSKMGDISCNCAFSKLAIVPGSGLADVTELDGTPQSSRSGRLSSSSPAQSIWLPGVEGLWSMAKDLTCSTSESMFAFVEELGTARPAERWGGVFFDRDVLRCGDDGPERDLRVFTVDPRASADEPSDDIVAPEGLLCDRRRRVDILEEEVDAECGADGEAGDAGSIVNEGSLSAACRGAR